jgi:hypothetical protein
MSRQIGSSSRLPNYSRILNFFLLSSLTCSQIWLIPLVDDSQCGGWVHNKIERKNPVGGGLSNNLFLMTGDEHTKAHNFLKF